MIYIRHRAKGFSLLEVLLVMAIVATIMVSILSYTTQKSDEMRRDRTVMQMEQFLNAGLSYYVSFGSWPLKLMDLQNNLFLPNGTIRNAWGQVFTVGNNSTDANNPGSGPLFSVCTTITGQQAFTAATIIAGRLPLASALDGGTASDPCPRATQTPCASTSTTCTVVSSVNIPGQNLNNARSINFAGLYHNGACVPAPSCPNPTMIPTIMAVPVSVTGMNDVLNASNIYPVSSFTAYVTGTSQSDNTPTNQPGDCDTDQPASCYLDDSTTLPTGKYWRVCLRIITQKGVVNYKSNNMDAGIILALTRCAPQNEYTTPSVYGSPFTVFNSTGGQAM